MNDTVSPKRRLVIVVRYPDDTADPRSLVVKVRDALKIGRDQRSHVKIVSDSVSRMHAVIEVERDGGLCIIDLGSGTKVNGVPVNKADLKVGDTFTVGDVNVDIMSFDEVTEVDPASTDAPKVASRPTPPPSAPKPASDDPVVEFLKGAGVPVDEVVAGATDIGRSVVTGFRRAVGSITRAALKIERETR